MNHFKAIFLVGGPGSGKDLMIHSVLREHNLLEVSLDKFFHSVLESKNIKELYNYPSLVINGNADSREKTIITKAILEEMGYDTSMIFVYTTDEVSKNRNDFRISKGSKTFSESSRSKKYNTSINNMHEYFDIFESFIIYDNSNNIVAVDGEKRKEVSGWLKETSEIVTGFLTSFPTNKESLKWLAERVMEAGMNGTAEFSAKITPGQKGNKPLTYKKANLTTKQQSCDCGKSCSCGDKYNGGVASANVNSPTRSYAAEEFKKRLSKRTPFKSDPPGKLGDVRNMAVGSTGIASVATGSPVSEANKKKRLVPSNKDGLKNFWNSDSLGNQTLVNPLGTS